MRLSVRAVVFCLIGLGAGLWAGPWDGEAVAQTLRQAAVPKQVPGRPIAFLHGSSLWLNPATGALAVPTRHSWVATSLSPDEKTATRSTWVVDLARTAPAAGELAAPGLRLTYSGALSTGAATRPLVGEDPLVFALGARSIDRLESRQQSFESALRLQGEQRAVGDLGWSFAPMASVSYTRRTEAGGFDAAGDSGLDLFQRNRVSASFFGLSAGVNASRELEDGRSVTASGGAALLIGDTLARGRQSLDLGVGRPFEIDAREGERPLGVGFAGSIGVGRIGGGAFALSGVRTTIDYFSYIPIVTNPRSPNAAWRQLDVQQRPDTMYRPKTGVRIGTAIRF